ncbi:MAG: hypothetical protein P1R58_02590 [bacterium]|nr:hypothetical protein [bacterium]
MNDRPKYNFHDIIWAPIQALKAKKILVMTVSLVAAMLVFDLFAYLAPAAEGENLEQIWAAYGFFPVYSISYAGTFGQVIYALGAVAALLVVMMGMFCVAAIEVEDVRGNPFMSARKALKFGLDRFNQLILSELAIGAFLGFIVLLFVIFGLIGRIPYLGEWIVAAFFVLPGFVVAIITLFVFVVFQISLLLMPAVAAADKTEESFQTILQTFSTVIRQPFRWGGYTLYALVVGKLAAFVYAYFCYRAVQFSTWASALGGGDKIEGLVRSGLSHLPLHSDLVDQTMSALPGLDWSISISKYATGGTDMAAGYLMSVMLFLVFASIIGYFLAILATAQARTYIAIRYISDGYELHTEDSLFHQDENLNPPIKDEESRAS